MFAAQKLKWTLAVALALLLGVDVADRAGIIHLRAPSAKSMTLARGDILISSIDSRQNDPLSIGFQEFVSTQCLILHSRKEIRFALQQPAWLATKRGDSDEMLAEFSSRLTLDHTGGHIVVSYFDEDEKTALAAVQVVLSGYSSFVCGGGPDQLKEVGGTRTNIQLQLATLTGERMAICGEGVTPDAVERDYNNAVEERLKADAKLAQIQSSISLTRGQLLQQPSAPQIAADDPRAPALAALLSSEGAVRSEIDRAAPRVVELAGKVKALHAIQEQQDELQKRLDALNVRYDQLESDRQNACRIEIVSPGEIVGRVLATKKNNQWALVETNAK